MQYILVMNNLSIVFLSLRQRIGAIEFNEGDSGSIYWTIKLGVKFPPHFSPSSFILWDDIIIDPYLTILLSFSKAEDWSEKI